MIKIVWMLGVHQIYVSVVVGATGRQSARPTVGLERRVFLPTLWRREGTPCPCGFSMGGHRVCLTKNMILCYDFQNYYFLICYAYENIEKFFMIIHFLSS